MTLEEALKDFLAMYKPIVQEMKAYKSNEYKKGMAEGLAIAIEAIETILEEYDGKNCPGN